MVLEQHQPLQQLSLYREGFFEIQDANSQRVAQWMDCKPEMTVLDVCAGAGGKTLHLAALMQNKGNLLAFDTEPQKLRQLQKRSFRNGVKHLSIITNEETVLQQKVDGLLIDAPCSGLGTLGRNPDLKWRMTPNVINGIQKHSRHYFKSTLPR